jgi:hypothetical protein
MKQTALTVRVPATLARLVERKAVRDGISKSEVIRIALIRVLDDPLADPRAGSEKDADLQEIQPQKPTRRSSR